MKKSKQELDDSDRKEAGRVKRKKRKGQRNYSKETVVVKKGRKKCNATGTNATR